MVRLQPVAGHDLTPTEVFYNICLAVFMTVAFFGNTAVILTIIRTKKLQTMANYAILNLAVADCIFGATGTFTLWTNSISGRWRWDFQCIIDGTFGLLLITVSILTLVMIAVERYFAIVRQVKIQWSWKTALALGMTWFIGWWPASLPFYGVNEYAVQPNNVWCTGNWTLRGTDMAMTLFFVIMIVSAVGIILFCYGAIYWKIRTVTRAIRTAQIKPHVNSSGQATAAELSTNSTDVAPSSQPQSPQQTQSNGGGSTTARLTAIGSASTTTTVTKSNPHSKEENKNPSDASSSSSSSSSTSVSDADKYERRATIRMVVVVFSFMLFWTPALLYVIYELITGKHDNPEYMFFVDWGTAANPAFNPFIYAYFDPLFKTELKKFFLCQCRFIGAGSTAEHHSQPHGNADGAGGGGATGPHGASKRTITGGASVKGSRDRAGTAGSKGGGGGALMHTFTPQPDHPVTDEHQALDSVNHGDVNDHNDVPTPHELSRKEHDDPPSTEHNSINDSLTGAPLAKSTSPTSIELVVLPVS